MVKIMENPTKRDDLGVFNPYFRKHLNIQQATGFLKNLGFLNRSESSWTWKANGHLGDEGEDFSIRLNHMKSPVKRW